MADAGVLLCSPSSLVRPHFYLAIPLTSDSYNAAVFKVITNNEYRIFAVDRASQEFKNLNKTANDDHAGFRDYVQLQNNEWKHAYDRQYLSTHGDLHLVISRIAFATDANLSNTSISDYLMPEKEGSQGNLRDITPGSPDWIDYGVDHPVTNEYLRVSGRVSHAFARNKQDLRSRVQISLYFMIVVISFNALKLFIMLWVLMTDTSSQYLVTLGDAASSFLERPDSTTEGKCMLGREEILINMGHKPSHPVSSPEEANQRALRLSSTWLPTSHHYFYPVHREYKVLYTLL